MGLLSFSHACQLTLGLDWEGVVVVVERLLKAPYVVGTLTSFQRFYPPWQRFHNTLVLSNHFWRSRTTRRVPLPAPNQPCNQQLLVLFNTTINHTSSMHDNLPSLLLELPLKSKNHY